eukprot:CAMPEP_0176171918 /NCGR_PEP_ID=MMETSP0120_2-20121206/88048_1 /TAXON_ID=160619 /ORGANISM="Kryptoperidinium foliaceum, Strain CCMP 1326" /LENGTH=40 /DNA_ID= /DNA_START= /DNA_END= /DNA_ORIENTATION=
MDARQKESGSESSPLAGYSSAMDSASSSREDTLVEARMLP